MPADILPFAPPQSELDAAWEAYDAARLIVERLYRDETSTADQRRDAVMAANRLHQAFYRLCRREVA